GSRMTAAANTGPASGPRPASSTPAMRMAAVLSNAKRECCISADLVKNRPRSKARGIAIKSTVQCRVTLRELLAVCGVGKRFKGGLRQPVRRCLVLQELWNNEVLCQYVGQPHPGHQRCLLAGFPRHD